jgi:hypothetical protein
VCSVVCVYSVCVCIVYVCVCVCVCVCVLACLFVLSKLMNRKSRLFGKL